MEEMYPGRAQMITKTHGEPAGRFAISIPELASSTGLSEALLYSKANEGALPGCRRVGKRFVVHAATFENWLADGMGQEFE